MSGFLLYLKKKDELTTNTFRNDIDDLSSNVSSIVAERQACASQFVQHFVFVRTVHAGSTSEDVALYIIDDCSMASTTCQAGIKQNVDEITELVWLCALERYFNTMALPLRIGSDHLEDAVRAR